MKTHFFFRNLVIISLLISFCHKSAQSQTVNDQLRYLFSQLTPPTNPPADALYDMAAHMTDTRYWKDSTIDTSSTNNFSMMYDEFRYMLYDTTNLDPTEDIYMNHLNFSGDTIALSLLFRHYNQFKDSALNSMDTIYFTVDTITGQLLDYGNRVDEPYLHKTLFSFAPMEAGVLTNHITFRVDPDYLFIDSYNLNDFDKERWQLQIDLDDGSGWQTVSHTSVSHFPVVYTNGPEDRLLRARVINSSGNTLKFSQSSFKVIPSSQQPDLGDAQFSMNGMNIGIYEGCVDPQQPPMEKKYIIYAEGFDIFESVDVSDIWNRIKNSRLAELRNHGYTFVVVDWQNSARDMRDNANSLISLINWLKCQIATGNNDIEPQHPFVVMGESMGGVIARYALTKMENMTPSGCLPNILHNTRLYVSIDAPHQGANVPMAFQEAYKDLLGPFYHLPINMQVKGIWIRNYLNSKAPRQLLANHVSSKAGNSYFPHIDRVIFMNDMLSLDNGDGYPDHVKKVAISDGLLTGEHQLDITLNNTMDPGDNYLDASANTMLSILGFPILGISGSMNLRAMPAIGNTFYDRNVTLNHWTITINWTTITLGWCPFCVNLNIPTGFSLTMTSNTISSYSAANGNLPPMDVMPGGLLSFDDAIDGGTLSGQMDVIDWTVDPIRVPGTVLTIPGFQAVGLNLDWNVVSDGLTFNFVPVQSALDYSGAANRLDHDIFFEPINIKLAGTPFDVIMGEYNGIGGFPNGSPENSHHTRVFNHDVNIPLANGLNQYMINREVGEEEMWMDNWHSHNTMHPILQAEYVFIGGRRENMYYDYPGQLTSHVFYPNPLQINNGAFSKDAPFRIDLMADIRSGGAFIDNGIVGPYNWFNVPQLVCSQTFRKIERGNPEIADEIDKLFDINIYPNPSAGEFNIEFGEEYTQPQVLIMNSNAQVIYELRALENKVSIGSELGLQSGVYLIRIIDKEKKPFTQKLIIQ